jgi:hypothetical protein
LVFDSEATTKNASGDPEKDSPKTPRQGGNLAITVEGSLIKN